MLFCGCGSVLTVYDMLSTFGFVENMFSYYGANRPKCSTTLYFEEVRQVRVPVERQTTTVFGSFRGCSIAQRQSLLSTVTLLCVLDYFWIGCRADNTRSCVSAT